MHLLQTMYGPFFNIHMWIDIFTNPVNWGLIATLIVLEGLLSSDNAIVLAVKVKHLPKNQQKKALLYGLGGAYLFRFVAIGLGTTLVKLWFIKAIGGAYLVWMAVKYLMEYIKKKRNGEEDEEEEQEQKSKFSGLARYIGVFWMTVASVELMDIAFSVDSVLAAFGISDIVGILLLGGMLGILMMRGVAQLFTKLMEKVPELEHTAYIIVCFIGVKMLLSIIHFEISSAIFFSFLAVAIGGTVLIHFSQRKKFANE